MYVCRFISILTAIKCNDIHTYEIHMKLFNSTHLSFTEKQYYCKTNASV